MNRESIGFQPVAHGLATSLGRVSQAANEDNGAAAGQLARRRRPSCSPDHIDDV